MTNDELNARRMKLKGYRLKIAGKPAFAVAGEIKAAAELAAEITDELARREIERDDLGALGAGGTA